MTHNPRYALERPSSPNRSPFSGSPRPIICSMHDSYGSTITANRDGKKLSILSPSKFLSYESPKAPNHSQKKSVTMEVLKFMTPRRKKKSFAYEASPSPKNTNGTFGSSLNDLESFLKSPPGRRGKPRMRTAELLSHSTGEIKDSPTYFSPRPSIYRMPLSAGANDIESWQKNRRRRRGDKAGLRRTSASLRSLPRDLDIQIEEEEHEAKIESILLGDEESCSVISETQEETNDSDFEDDLIGSVADLLAGMEFPGAPLMDSD